MKKTIIGVVSLATLVCLGGLYLNKEEIDVKEPEKQEVVKTENNITKADEKQVSVSKGITIEDCKNQLNINNIDNDYLNKIYNEVKNNSSYNNCKEVYLEELRQDKLAKIRKKVIKTPYYLKNNIKDINIKYINSEEKTISLFENSKLNDNTVSFDYNNFLEVSSLFFLKNKLKFEETYFSEDYNNFPMKKVIFQIEDKKFEYISNNITYYEDDISIRFYEDEPISGMIMSIEINIKEESYLVKIETWNNFYHFKGKFNDKNVILNKKYIRNK